MFFLIITLQPANCVWGCRNFRIKNKLKSVSWEKQNAEIQDDWKQTLNDELIRTSNRKYSCFYKETCKIYIRQIPETSKPNLKERIADSSNPKHEKKNHNSIWNQRHEKRSRNTSLTCLGLINDLEQQCLIR